MHLPARLIRHRAVAALGLGAVLVTTCSGGAVEQAVPPVPVAAQPVVAVEAPFEDAPPASPPLDPTSPSGPVSGLPTSDGDQDDTAPEEVVLAEEVEVHQPDLVLRGEEGEALAVDDVEELLDDEALHAATAAEFDVEAEGSEGERRDLTALAVEADDFRPLTPDVTAQTVGVWERLLDGDVLVRHDIAHELGLELGGTVTLRTGAGTVPARIGAFAANGAPPLADLLVPRDLGALLGAEEPNTLIVAGADDARRLGDRLRETVGGAFQLLEPPPEKRAEPRTTGSVKLEPFSYRSRGDGTIAIDPSWVARNIVRIEIPGMGPTRCHRVMVPQLMAALREIADEGLYGHLKPDQFAGCWVPRHILWNPDRGLSMHAWGLAIDFNTRENAYGATPQMDPRIVEIFEKWGFEWGGWWSTPDGMHFELDRVVEVE